MLMSKYTVYTNLFMFDCLLNKQTQAQFEGSLYKVKLEQDKAGLISVHKQNS